MICKTTLDKLGKAAFNALTDQDKQKYLTASGIISIVSDIVKTGNVQASITQVTEYLLKVGETLLTNSVITLAAQKAGYAGNTLTGALTALAAYVQSRLVSLIDNVKHDLANTLALLFGINENPGVLGAIMEWIYKSLVKPALTAL